MSIAAMTVRDVAYSEVYDWLDNDEQGPKPAPEEGMHELALREWWAGHDEAHADFSVEQDKWETLENFAFFVVKSVILYGILWFAFRSEMPLVQVGAGVMGLIFLWKFWR